MRKNVYFLKITSLNTHIFLWTVISVEESEFDHYFEILQRNYIDSIQTISIFITRTVSLLHSVIHSYELKYLT